jgi:hypothetical protein
MRRRLRRVLPRKLLRPALPPPRQRRMGRGYGGWYVLEQDTILTEEPRDAGPVKDVQASADYLRKLLAA